jgi:hypothetical protein
MWPRTGTATTAAASPAALPASAVTVAGSMSRTWPLYFVTTPRASTWRRAKLPLTAPRVAAASRRVWGLSGDRGSPGASAAPARMTLSRP